MTALLISFSSSLIATYLLIRFERIHSHLTADSDRSGPQKFHSEIVPRIGGIPIFIGLLFAITIDHNESSPANIFVKLLVCAIPVFAIGTMEDITKKISVRKRLFFTIISSLIFIYLLETKITRLGVPFLDQAFTLAPVCILFTLFSITGLCNSYNIIDGFNGLSSMVGLLTLLGLAYIGMQVSDQTITNLSLIMMASILGFFVWNYPKGLIFLGDGGAYLIGFWIATLSVMIVERHSSISPWFAILINGYPIFETAFTIYRRKFRQKSDINQPDGLHFHSLLYRWLLTHKSKNLNLVQINSSTSPFVWILATVSIAFGVAWFQSTPTLIVAFLIFCFFYIFIYYKLRLTQL